MASTIQIRPERAGDAVAIREVISAAFLGMPSAAGDEADFVEMLRAQNALTVSLVAESDGAIVGQVAISPSRLASGVTGWTSLGPVAVLPDHQRNGIGSRLVRAGLEAIAALGAAGCILTGNPDFFSRFGFEEAPRSLPRGGSSGRLMVRVFPGRGLMRRGGPYLLDHDISVVSKTQLVMPIRTIPGFDNIGPPTHGNIDMIGMR